MKTFVFGTVFTVIFATITFSCGMNKTAKTQPEVKESHSSVNALDWQGVYKGVLPCADCQGIETKITLKKDGTFQRSMKYLGKDDKIFSDEGKFIWNEKGTLITFELEGEKQQYKVGENVLYHLDRDGNQITGDLASQYMLAKNLTDPRLEDKKWVLTTLRGKPFEYIENKPVSYIQFSMETGMFSGNNTCNNFFGQYELLEGNRLKLGEAGATLMACPDMANENIFMEVLRLVDNYTVSDSLLSLNKARMAPLAQFRLEDVQ